MFHRGIFQRYRKTCFDYLWWPLQTGGILSRGLTFAEKAPGTGSISGWCVLPALKIAGACSQDHQVGWDCKKHERPTWAIETNRKRGRIAYCATHYWNTGRWCIGLYSHQCDFHHRRTDFPGVQPLQCRCTTRYQRGHLCIKGRR